MKLKLDRIISIATLVAAVAAIFLVLKRPAPVVQVQAPAATVASAQVSGPSMQAGASASQQALTVPASGGDYAAAAAPVQNQAPVQNAQPAAPSTPAKAESHSDSGGIAGLLAQAAGSAGLGGLSPDASVGQGEPTIKDQQVTYEGDVVHGRFLTEIAGKDVWVTISGHMGSKDGYATFEPTEFKVGDVNVPVSLVNPMLQRKLAEQRDKLKVPE